MGVEVWDEKLEETYIVTVTIINPRPISVLIPEKYRCLFHGSPMVSYGRHRFKFPITHIGYKRLVSSFQVDFSGVLKVDFGGNDFDSV